MQVKREYEYGFYCGILELILISMLEVLEGHFDLSLGRLHEIPLK
jgi:hypothetical protein